MDRNYINKVGNDLAISERLEIRLAVVVKDEVYFSFVEFKEQHPNDDYHFGYVVYDFIDNCVPECYNPWYFSPESALEEYKIVSTLPKTE
ncbi:MAG: hypothetical protein J5992_09710 [Oscillospiraceae bacterium]|nr:hypothetical protein [Oscillospiraceae bacterium]